MDHRTKSRLTFGIATIIIIIVVGLSLVLKDTKEETIISPFSDLYQPSYENNIFEIVPSAEIYDVSAKKVKYLNIHCTASSVDLSKQWLLNFFKYTRKWSKPGYNLVVRFDGSIDTLVSFNCNGYVEWSEISYGVKGRNSESINIAYTGGIDKYGNPVDTRTNEQKRTLEIIVANIRNDYPWIEVVGHRDHHGVSKACPSFDVLSEYGGGVSPDHELFDSPEDSM